MDWLSWVLIHTHYLECWPKRNVLLPGDDCFASLALFCDDSLPRICFDLICFHLNIFKTYSISMLDLLKINENYMKLNFAACLFNWHVWEKCFAWNTQWSLIFSSINWYQSWFTKGTDSLFRKSFWQWWSSNMFHWCGGC